MGSKLRVIALPSFVALTDFKRITSICMKSLLQVGPACLPDKRPRSRARPCGAACKRAGGTRGDSVRRAGELE